MLLQREAHVSPKEELQTQERGRAKRFDGSEDPIILFPKGDAVTVLKAGKYVVQLVQVNEPYSDNLEAAARNLPRQEQKKSLV